MKKIIIKDIFKNDYITREAGEKLRLLIFKSVSQKERMLIDFSGVTVASTSFFDEGFAKLTEEGWDKKTLAKWIEIKNIHPMDEKLISQMCDLRKMK